MDESTPETAEPMASDKVPITTTSAAAREAFLAGRALIEDLHVTESRPYFEEAISLDSSIVDSSIRPHTRIPNFPRKFGCVSAGPLHASMT